MKFGLGFLSGDGLRGRSIRASLLTVLNFSSSNLLRLASNLILTRILFPEAFGIMALVTVFLTGLNMFSDLGVRASIVQNKRGADPAFLDTAWLIQIARGIILWLATCLIAGPAANFYDTPILAELLPVAGLTAVLQGLNSTKTATASREVRLGRVTVMSLSARFIGILVLIALAWWWQSVWALVVGGLVGPLLIMIASHLFLPGHNNRFRFEWRAASQLISFGKFVFISTLAGFLISQADRAILGKFITLDQLAFYNIAFFLATVPRLILQRLSSSVLFPLYSRRPPKQSRENHLNVAKARLGVVTATMAMATVLAVIGNELILFLYDDRYALSGPLLVLMVIASLPTIVTGNYGQMILASGDSKRFAILMVISAIFRTAILFFAIVNYGVLGAVLTPLVATVLFYPVSIWFIRPYGGWLPGQDAVFALLSIAIAVLAIWFNQEVLLNTWEQLIELASPSGPASER